MQMNELQNSLFNDSLFMDLRCINMCWLNCVRIQINLIFVLTLFVWFAEWIDIFGCICGEYYTSFVIFPLKLTWVLVISIFYWAYLWGMGGWRSSQYGRFTRNERRLWIKGYAAFWIIELVTLFSFVVVFAWLSWGPIVLMHRYFLVPRKGLILEFIFYSYLIFLTYVANLNMRWNLWNFQLILALFVVILLSYLFWRDILILFTRENMMSGYSAQWRNVNLTGLVYALSHEWWVMHSLGHRSVNFNYSNLHTSFSINKNPIDNVIVLMEYELNLWIEKFVKVHNVYNTYLGCAHLFNLWGYYADFNMVGGQNYFYATRLGFIPNRIAIWELLLFFKMWHQLIILAWWLLYIFSLENLKTGSYHFLSVCYFNIYCCYLFGLVIYLLSFFVVFEMIFRFRPNNFSSIHWIMLLSSAFIEILRIVFSWEEYPRNNELVSIFSAVNYWMFIG